MLTNRSIGLVLFYRSNMYRETAQASRLNTYSLLYIANIIIVYTVSLILTE